MSARGTARLPLMVAAVLLMSGCAQTSAHTPPTASSTRFPTPSPGAVVTSPPYPTNANGMTYGSGLTSGNRGPQLVAAYGTRGEFGYIRRSDELGGPTPTALVTTGAYGRSGPIPLYAQDGVTQIGWYGHGGGPLPSATSTSR